MDFEYNQRIVDFANLLNLDEKQKSRLIQVWEERDRQLEDTLQNFSGGGSTVGSVVSLTKFTTIGGVTNGDSHGVTGITLDPVPASSSIDSSGNYFVEVESVFHGIPSGAFGQFLASVHVALGGTLNDGIFFTNGGFIWLDTYPAFGAPQVSLRARAYASCTPGSAVDVAFDISAGAFGLENSDNITWTISTIAKVYSCDLNIS